MQAARVNTDGSLDTSFGSGGFTSAIPFPIEGGNLAFMWRGGCSDVSLMRTNFKQLHGDLIDARYITEQEFGQDSARLDDPEFMTPSPIMWTAWGRRPTA
jgi:hypothetical protein